jgi:ribose 5-phosphate isomerase B
MKIGIAADHRGYKLKQKVTRYLKKKGYVVIDYSPYYVPLDDYPDHGIMLGEKIVSNEVDYGIGICSNGIGMSIACNKVKGARCGKVDSIKEAKSARLEDDINIIALNSTKPFYLVKKILITFLTTNFSGVDRYIRRINELKEYEENGKLS